MGGNTAVWGGVKRSGEREGGGGKVGWKSKGEGREAGREGEVENRWEGGGGSGGRGGGGGGRGRGR